MPLFDLKQLRSFLAVAERLSFVRAAEHLHLSQPALTAQIQNLEAELDMRLLERNRRTVRLTDAGSIFVAEARATLDRAQLAADRARMAAGGEIGTLSVGFVSSAALEIVPRIVARFRRQHPGVRLHLTNQRTVYQVSGLLDGRGISAPATCASAAEDHRGPSRTVCRRSAARPPAGGQQASAAGRVA